MHVVLGVSMASTTVCTVLVGGENADGVIVEQDDLGEPLEVLHPLRLPVGRLVLYVAGAASAAIVITTIENRIMSLASSWVVARMRFFIPS